MKKLIVSCLLLLCALLCLAFVGCNKEEEEICDHTYGEWIVTKIATCDEAGSQTKTCSKCSERVVEDVPALGHDLTDWVVVTKVSCVKDGMERQTCKTCKKVMATKQVVATGHSFGENDKCTTCKQACGTTMVFTLKDGEYVLSDYTGTETTVAVPLTYKGVKVTSIGKAAFENTKIKVITITNNITTIGENAFDGCKQLATVTISDSVTTIGNNAFKDCTKLKNLVLPTSVKTIGTAIFGGCKTLASITVPFIGPKVDATENCFIGYFFGATSYEDQNAVIPTTLKNVTVRGGTSIADFAFYRCTGLTTLMLPNTVESIGRGAFNYCTAFSTIYFNGTAAEWNRLTGGQFIVDSKGVYFYSEEQPTDGGRYWHYDGNTVVTW